jgi:hypothetical protein
LIFSKYKNPVQKIKNEKKENSQIKQNKQKIYISNNDKRQNRKELILNFITEKRLDGQNEGVMIKDILGKIKDISEKTLQRELSAYSGGKNGYLPEALRTSVSLWRLGKDKRLYLNVILRSENRDADTLKALDLSFK